MILAEYIDHMGNDDRVVNAARVSFAKEARNFPPENNAGLIRFLARNGHWTPFAHAMLTLRETVPLFVARQRFKHQVGFVENEMSRRYVDSPPDFYIETLWRRRPPKNIKQGSAEAHPRTAYWQQRASDFTQDASALYNEMIDDGIAPEQARMLLPQSTLTSYYVTGSLAAFARAYNQRSETHAQLEIQSLAKQWKQIIEPLFPVSWHALTTQPSHKALRTKIQALRTQLLEAPMDSTRVIEALNEILAA